MASPALRPIYVEACQSSPFKSLQGQWAISAGSKTLPFQMTYALGSNGSVVTEQFGKELSVFYSDQGNLLMTHFCNRGNQPRLKLKAGGAAGRYEFDLFDITNLKDPSDDHVQAIIYEIPDPQHIRLEIVWKKGDGEESEKYAINRLSAISLDFRTASGSLQQLG